MVRRSFIEPTTPPSPQDGKVPPGTVPVFSASPQYSSQSGQRDHSAVRSLQPPASPGDGVRSNSNRWPPAVIEVPTGTKAGEPQDRSPNGQAARAPTPVPVSMDFYDVAIFTGAPAPASQRLESIHPLQSTRRFLNPWAALLPPSLYLQIPTPPKRRQSVLLSICGPTVLRPHSMRCWTRCKETLKKDPGGAITATTTTTARGGQLDLAVSGCDYRHHLPA